MLSLVKNNLSFNSFWFKILFSFATGLMCKEHIFLLKTWGAIKGLPNSRGGGAKIS